MEQIKTIKGQQFYWMDSQEIKKIYNYGVNFIAINCY